MKHNNLFLWLLGLTVCWLAACSEEDGRVKYPYSCPELSGLQFSTTDQTPAADSLYFSVKIHDPETPLSTLEVKLMVGETLVSSQSIRTKGTDVSIVEKGIYIPFEADLEENQEAKVVLTAINVEGSEVTQTFDFHIVRPQIPEVLYLHYNGEVVEMTRSAENPYLYLTEVSGSEEGYPMELTGKISTAESLDDAELIWGAAEKSNTAVLIEASGPSFAFDYRDWFVEQITFDVMTFKLGVVGFQKNLKIKETELIASEGFFRAQISFTQGEEFEMSGFEDVEHAYNRDFFSYNPDNGKFTFLRKSGTWEIYYSSKFNYIWVARMSDTAPTCFWLVGHGFTCAPVWNEAYNSGGWNLEDISQLGYIVPIGEQKYQTTVYLSNTHEWESFEIEIYSDLQWNKDKGMELQAGSLSGDTDGIEISASNGITSGDGFVPGYYRLTFDTSQGVGKETLHIERLSD